jgi:hypothetical protein
MSPESCPEKKILFSLKAYLSGQLEMHNLLNLALAKIGAPGTAVGHQKQAGGAKIAVVSISAKMQLLLLRFMHLRK